MVSVHVSVRPFHPLLIYRLYVDGSTSSVLELRMIIMKNLSPLGELAFLHEEFRRCRILFRNSRSINRLRRAVQNFVSPFGDLAAARHAVRFNLIGKGCRSKRGDLEFAIGVIRSYDTSKLSAIKFSIRSAKKMAHEIQQGNITGSTRRRAGSWTTQSNETALCGPSECKIFCKNIVHLNQMRQKRSRLTRPSISSLENARVTILFRH